MRKTILTIIEHNVYRLNGLTELMYYLIIVIITIHQSLYRTIKHETRILDTYLV